MDAPRLQRARGKVALAFGLRDGACRLLHHREEGCAKARFPRGPAGAVPEAVLLNTAGGLTDGDHVEQEVALAEGGGLVLTTQAAEKVYRARVEPATVRTRLTVGQGATLSWLPQETILFDAARLDRGLDVALATDAKLLLAECLVLGRTAHGEVVRTGALLDRRDIRIDGRLVLAERFRLDGDVDALRRAPSLLGGAVALATLLVVGAPDLLEPLRAIEPQTGVRVGASWREPVLVLRLLGPDALAVRTTLLRLIAPAMARLSPGATVPRVWQC